MSSLAFTKGHGTHNDFVLVFDEFGASPLNAELVRFLCDRRGGIGADGVIRAVRAGSLPEGAALAADAWFMDYWNADGTTSEMCGNGARVFAAFVEREAGEDFTDWVDIGTRGGLRRLKSAGHGHFAVDMGQWRVPSAAQGSDAEVSAPGVGTRLGLTVDVGNPHTVVALASDAELEAVDLSAAPTVIPVPPAGTNVEFVVPKGEVTGPGGERRGVVRMRVHERGSGETMSCGTGACATALAVRAWAGPEAPMVWDVHVPGGVVTVTIEAGRTILEGPAVLVADGVVAVP